MQPHAESLNLGRVERVLHELGRKLEPPAVYRLWDGILDDVLSAERKLFASGRGMKDIKRATERRKERDPDPRVRANAHRTLVATGALRDHMTSKGLNAQPLYRDADELRIGIDQQSSVFYGVLQVERGRDPRIPLAQSRRITSRAVKRHLRAR